MSRFLITNRNIELLEPYEGKLSRTVLRGGRGSNASDLPDKIVGWLMVLTCATIIGMGFLTLSINFSLMLPLALLYVCIGTMISGLVVNVPSITRITVAAAIIPVTLLIEMRSGQAFHASWNLMAAIAFLVALIIPGHILNHKAAKE